MSHDTRIGQIRLIASEDVQIGTAHTNASYTHQHFAIAT
jgi:hypothetical protein